MTPWCARTGVGDWRGPFDTFDAALGWLDGRRGLLSPLDRVDGTVRPPVDVLLVGEQPAAGRDGYPAFTPAVGSGARLARLSGVDDLLSVAATVNLLAVPGAWDPADAAEAAEKLLETRPESTFVLLGRRVATAFEVTAPWYTWSYTAGRRVAAVPHPSGRNRYWNDPENVEHARWFLRATLGTLDRRPVTPRPLDRGIASPGRMRRREGEPT